MGKLGKLDLGEIEQKWLNYWEKEKVFKFDPKAKGSIYAIDTPPPTVSGKMHIGHAFSYSQQDFIARFQRMRGRNVFYPFGTDDNGLPTEKLVEKINKVKSKDMSRKEFVDLCLKTLEKIRPQYVSDWKRIGMSCDWEIFYTTINTHCQKLSQKSFIDLYKAGREYRKKAPTIWCPECNTAIAQVEMEDVEKETSLSYIKGKLEDGSFIIYATTRPELHPGCVGISIDEKGEYVVAKRNSENWVVSKDAFEKMKTEFGLEKVKGFLGKEIVGKKVEIKFAEKPVFVSHDVSAKTEYGTGVVYYCSYGGLDCVEWLARHPEAEAVHVMDESGTYTKGPYRGMRSEKARKKIIDDLENEGLLVKNVKLRHTTNVHERCGTAIEYVATKQWFIKYLDLKDKFLKADSEIKWHPEHMRNRLDNWIKGLQWDWCISRQRHFGVAFPVWYCKKCDEVILADEKQLPVDPLEEKPLIKSCPKCKGNEFVGEKDVLDTWATSSLTPQIAASLVPGMFDKLYPMNLRPQAHDIISFWLFNTLVKSQMHNSKNPWKDVMISGWALDKNGRKMSKSKGNVVEPEEMIEKYSADILRYWAGLITLGEDVPLKEQEFVSGQKFVVKLYNAMRFVSSMMGNADLSELGKKKLKFKASDRWILSRISKIEGEAVVAFEKYEFSKVLNSLRNLFWLEFADFYIEEVKYRVYNEKDETRDAALYTLGKVAFDCLKMLAPFMPYISEEIYHTSMKAFAGKKSIHLDSWPVADKKFVDGEAEKTGQLMNSVISEIRKQKSGKNLALSTEIPELKVFCKDKKDAELLQNAADDIAGTMRIGKVEVVKGNAGENTVSVSENIAIEMKL